MENQITPVKVSLMARTRDWGRQACAFLLDQLYPPVCPGCGAPVSDMAGLCAPCWRQLQPITPPLCPVLGLPFSVVLGPEARSAEAIANPPPFDRARSAVLYSDMARKLVGRFKYRDRPDLAAFCARIMLGACAELLDDGPVLVPVPLHRWRQWRRNYNQALELARALGDLRDLDVAPELVMRRKPTRQQVGLTSDQRQRNVQGAFDVDRVALDAYAGRRIVIVDDVITTGATVRSVARAFKKAGAGQIDVISFARVVIGEETPI